jgi:crotonobetainyl-CoA:carnitine CoA-transferase CaiB-like acyl-CoA transferase
VLTIPQVLAEPQVLQRQVTANFDDVAGMDRPLTVLRGGFMVDGEAPLPTKPPPALGAHMDEIFAGLPPRTKAGARA